MYENYIIDGNAVYEIDEDCMGISPNGKCRGYINNKSDEKIQELKEQIDACVEVSVCNL